MLEKRAKRVSQLTLIAAVKCCYLRTQISNEQQQWQRNEANKIGGKTFSMAQPETHVCVSVLRGCEHVCVQGSIEGGKPAARLQAH